MAMQPFSKESRVIYFLFLGNDHNQQPQTKQASLTPGWRAISLALKAFEP